MSYHSGNGSLEPPQLPANDVAEQALLGAMMITPKVLKMAADVLTPEAFHFAGHPEIFAACLELDKRGLGVNAVTLANYLSKDVLGLLHGGKAYLADLQGSVVTLSCADDYVAVIADNHLRRQIMALCDDVKARAAVPSADDLADGLLEEAEREFRLLSSSSVAAVADLTIGDAVETSLDRTAKAMQIEGITGVTTGLHGLDKHLGGLQPGDLTVIAARPSIGKSALAVNNIAMAAARHNVPTAVFSLEMSAEQIASRQIASVCGISADRQRQGALANREYVDLREAGNTVAKLPLYIDDKPSVSSAYVRQRSRRLKTTKSVGLVVVDYLQLMREPTKMEKRHEIGQITSGLKALAKELHIPVVLLSQLSRQVENREDKRPILSDLRESGDIEQDADVVLFLYREGYYLDRCQPEESSPKYQDWRQRRADVGNKSEFIVAKNRMGPCNRVYGYFDGVRSLFIDRWESDNG